ncbi:MAG TPA: hypothetical protein VK666_06405 [Chryseolinea sp.]|nr:hypothetical protein [Chryseolinea sp.]
MIKTGSLSRPALSFLTPCIVFLFLSCIDDEPNSNSNTSPSAGNEVIVEWNRMAYTIANQHDQFFTFTGVRALGMAHIAMHDALNAITEKYRSYAFKEKHPDADPVTACCQAAFEVLISVYPDRKDTLQKELQRWLSAIKNDPAKEKGISLGKQSAAAILNLRLNDGYDANGTYTPTNKPGFYQYTPGHSSVWKPDLSRTKPFALKSVSQFRSPAPPALTSTEYTDSYKEIKDFGRLNSTVRTADQTNLGHWWAEFGEHSWNRIGRITATGQKLPLWETARLFALINMTLYDTYLASFDSKYTYDTWRPYTAVRNANQDDNPATIADTSWLPEMLTPPWPDYPSAHAAVGGAEAEIVSHVYGTPKVSFQMESLTALPAGKTRSYDNLDSAADDCANSRIMNGFHFRFSTEEGKKQGRKIARYIYSNYLEKIN